MTGHGEKWKRHRKMLTQAFHFDILKQYIPVYNEVCNKLLVCLFNVCRTVLIIHYIRRYGVN